MKKRDIVSYVSGKSFSERVVEAALAIPFGKVTTYGRIARAAGGPSFTAQSITSILGKAWERGVRNIPFHRIVYSDGRIWMNPECHGERMKKYWREGIQVDANGKIMNFREALFEFD